MITIGSKHTHPAPSSNVAQDSLAAAPEAMSRPLVKPAQNDDDKYVAVRLPIAPRCVTYSTNQPPKPT